MKFKQGLFLKGYITIIVKGEKLEGFLNICMKHDIPLWDLRKLSPTECEVKIHLRNLSKVKRIRRNTGHKISFKEKFGFPFIIAQLKYRQPLLIGVILCFLAILILSNMVWQIKIVGVSPEIEYKIKQRLDYYGLKEGKLKFTLDPLDDIERNITNELKDVMWVGIEQKGTTYIVQGVEKSLVHIEENTEPQHLVAKHEGEIMQMLVEKGQPKVRVNQHVDKGDVLVSGLIGGQTNEDEEKSKNNKQQQVHAEGKVYAKTMYTTETTIPLSYEHKTLTGNKDEHYKLSIGKISIPFWDFFSPNYSSKFEEVDKKPIHFFNMRLPFSIEKKIVHEQDTIKGKRTEKQAIEEGIAQAKRELKKHMDYDAEILDVQILHQSTENDTVKLELFFTVKENIAVPQPITQGD